MLIVAIPFNLEVVGTQNGTVNGTQNVIVNKEYSYELLLSFIKEIKRFKQIDIINEFNISRRTVQRIINKLISNGLIKRVGSDKSGYYEIIDDNKVIT